MNKQKILIIDHDPSILSTLVGFLSDEPYDISTTRDGIEGLEILRREKIDLAIAEMYMAGLDGIALLERAAAEKIQTNILIMESFVPMEVTEKILKAGTTGVLDKPIVKDKFLAEVKTCILLNEVEYNVSRTSEASRSQPRSFQQLLNTGREKVSPEALESFLEERYRNPDLKFEDLARHFRITPPHCHVLFKKFFNKTFREKLREIRISQAEHFLTGSSLFIYEIAPLCGFHSSSRFCHAFKRIHGIAPTQYRKKVRYGEIQPSSEDV
ncbi:MAG: DNA-binding response regulator [Gemmatimonadetes bacterium]|nr:DNA-binding response regulator [Gemmatimonadota bacterium]